MFSVLAADTVLSGTHSETKKGLVLILTGPPGSGKGTHASPLSEELGVPHISTGDLFRAAIRDETPLGVLAKGYIDRGSLVPDELVIDMLFDRVSKSDCENGYILDGFPRTIAQAKALDLRLKSLARVVVLNFQLEDSVIIERITGRIACSNCSKLYHVKFAPPEKEMLCDSCSHPLYHRSDDCEEIIRKRLEVYREETQPLIEYYRSQKGVLHEIDSNHEKSQVFYECVEAIPTLSFSITE